MAGLRKFGVAVVAFAALCGSGAVSQDSIHWKDVGGWTVSVDPTLNNGCYAFASWNEGTVVRIGRDPDNGTFYFLIGNDAWESLSHGSDYEISIQFDRRGPWDVDAQGFQFNPGEVVYLHAQSSQMEFIREFQRANNMKISYQGREIDNLRLTGSRRAWDEVEVCQRAMSQSGIGSAKDPFANSN